MESIDTNTIEGKLAVMQAYKNGKKIRIRPRDMDSKDSYWDICDPYVEPFWNWTSFDFSIVEEPKNSVPEKL